MMRYLPFLLLVGAPLVMATPAVSQTAPPNLVFVMSDQHSWDMLGAYGNRDVITPNLDKLATEGVRFNHCVSTSPVCTPYRGMLLSGQHSLRQGTFQNDLQMLPGKSNYLAEVLRDGGYRTGYYGKWHLMGGDRVRGVPPGPLRYGFDHEFLVNNCTLVFDAKRAYYWDQDGITKRMYGDWEPYAQTRQAMEFLDKHARRPFALFLAWHPPHNWGVAHEGYDAPADLLALYDPAKLTLRPTVEDTPKVRRLYQGHMAMITSCDRAFGWLMEKLDALGIRDNTIVIFTSDHGDTLLSYGWPNNKGRAEHLSSRVPFIIRWPAKLKPGTNDSLLGTLDLMPTLLGLLDLPIPRTCEGRNVSRSLLSGRTDRVKALPLFFTPLNWRGIYTERYTYSASLFDPDESGIARGAATFDVLYDRQEDPWETRNLFHDPAYGKVKAQLHRGMLKLMKRHEDHGLRNNDMLRLAVRPDDLKNVLTGPAKRPPGWEGRLKGPPVELFREQKAVSKK